MLHQAGLAEHSEWRLFAPVLALSFVCMLPLIILAEKTRHARTIFLGSITAIGVAQFLLYSAQLHLVLIAAILLLFFTAFTLLEASLPSMISKSAPSSGKGTALGVYSSCQFLGIFTGGTLGGWLYGQLGVSSVFSACGVLALLWLVTASGMTFPKQQQRTRLEESS